MAHLTAVTTFIVTLLSSYFVIFPLCVPTKSANRPIEYPFAFRSLRRLHWTTTSIGAPSAIHIHMNLFSYLRTISTTSSIGTSRYKQIDSNVSKDTFSFLPNFERVLVDNPKSLLILYKDIPLDSRVLNNGLYETITIPLF